MGTYSLTKGTGSNSLPVNDLTLPGGAAAQYVKFSITQNWGQPGFVGLSEVEFEGTAASAVPEPSTLGLTFLAAGLLPLLIKRRRARPVRS